MSVRCFITEIQTKVCFYQNLTLPWPQNSVAMVTMYFCSSRYTHDTCQVSHQCDVPLQKYSKKPKYRQKILQKWLYRNLTSELWPLTFTSGNLGDTSFNPGLHSHQVWKRSVQPTRRSRSYKFPLFSSSFRLKIHTSPSITWPLMPVAMVTI